MTFQSACDKSKTKVESHFIACHCGCPSDGPAALPILHDLVVYELGDSLVDQDAVPFEAFGYPRVLKYAIRYEHRRRLDRMASVTLPAIHAMVSVSYLLFPSQCSLIVGYVVTQLESDNTVESVEPDDEVEVFLRKPTASWFALNLFYA